MSFINNSNLTISGILESLFSAHEISLQNITGSAGLIENLSGVLKSNYNSMITGSNTNYSGYVENNFATLYYLNVISGVLNQKIQTGVGITQNQADLLYYSITNNNHFIKSGEVDNKLNGLISTGSCDLRYLVSGTSGQFYLKLNSNNFISSGDVDLKLNGLISTGNSDNRYLFTGFSGQIYKTNNPLNFTNSGNLETTGTNLRNQLISLSGQLDFTGLKLNTSLNLLSGNIYSGLADPRPQFYINFSTGPITWSSMPAALNFFNANTSYITYADLTNYTGVNLIVNKGATAATTSGALFLKYLDNPSFTASNYKDLDSSSVKIKIDVQNTLVNSGFKPINLAARSGIYIALCGSSGNSSISPIFGNISAIFR
jgi:hypothetical protein